MIGLAEIQAALDAIEADEGDFDTMIGAMGVDKDAFYLWLRETVEDDEFGVEVKMVLAFLLGSRLTQK